MILFLLTFFLLYGGLHLCFFLKLRSAFAPALPGELLIVGLLVLGMISPFMVRAAERFGLETLAAVMSWTGYLWMAVLFLFGAAALLMDGYRLLVWAAGAVGHTDRPPVLPGGPDAFPPSPGRCRHCDGLRFR